MILLGSTTEKEKTTRLLVDFRAEILGVGFVVFMSPLKHSMCYAIGPRLKRMRLRRLRSKLEAVEGDLRAVTSFWHQRFGGSWFCRFASI